MAATHAELQLLLASLTGPPDLDSSDGTADLQGGTSDAVAQLVADVATGRYAAALRSAAHHGVLPAVSSVRSAAATPAQPSPAADGSAPSVGSGGGDSHGDLAAFFQAVQAQAAAVFWGDTAADSASSAAEPLVLLAAAVAALLLFLQANLTGPQPADIPDSPADLLALPTSGIHEAESGAGDSGGIGSGGVGRSAASAADRWAVAALAASGEEALGRIYLPQYLLLALSILLPPLGLQAPCADTAATHMEQWAQRSQLAVPVTWSWWAARALATQQRVLSGRAATLRETLQQLMQQVVSGFDGGAAAKTLTGGDAALCRRLAAAAQLEAAAVEQAFGDVKAADAHLAAAEAALGMSVELTGALGTRTIHQVDPKAQLLVRVAAPSDSTAGAAAAALSTAAAAASSAGAATNAPADVLTASGAADNPGTSSGAAAADIEPGAAAEKRVSEDESGDEVAALDAALEGSSVDLTGMAEDVDVLPAPRIMSAAGGVEVPAGLGTLEQALLLARAAQVKKGRAADELAGWEAAPFAEAVLQQRHSRPLLWAAAHLLKARHERGRPRTRDRALLTLQRLADALMAEAPPPADRLRLAFAVAHPLGVTLRKELGEGLIASGLIGSALPMFEELELWDSLILCYRMLGKAPQAEALIQARLQETPDEARLWCALGDLRMDDACYATAWERSGQRFARAKRSLARSAMRKKDYRGGVGHWEAALALNPLHPDGWFALGFAALKAGDDTRAGQAFTRTVQQEADNGDAWANIAAVHLQHRSWGPAFTAAAEAVKHKRESWQMWSNYALAAAHAGHPLKALRGAAQVLELTGGQRLETEVLATLVARLSEALSAEVAPTQAPAAAGGGEAGATPAGSSIDDSNAAAASGGLAAQQAAADGALPGATAEAASPVAASANEASVVAAAAAAAAADLSLQDDDAGQQEAAEAADAAPEQLTQHETAQLRSGLAQVLKKAAGTAAGDSALWGLLAKFYRATRETTSEREALVRHIRGLQGSAWKQDAAAFEAYGDAVLQLAGLYIAAAEAGQPSVRDLSSARMQLKGTTQQTRERFEVTPTFERLAAALEQLNKLLESAKAAAA